MNYAQLQGASLFDAQLQGARLFYAELRGTNLSRAQLQGASLIEASLQGADLLLTISTNAVLLETAVWRALHPVCGETRVLSSNYNLSTRRKIVGEPYIDKPIFGWPNIESRETPESIDEFIAASVAEIPDPKAKQKAIERMRKRLIVDPAADDTAAIEKRWRACEEASSKTPQAEFDEKHASLLRDIVCDAKDSRSAIAKGIVRIWISDEEWFWVKRNVDRRAFSAQLARGLLGEDGKPCAATKDLDEADIWKLRAAIARAPKPLAPTAPAPPSSSAAPQSASPVAAPAAAAAPAPAQSPPK